MVSNRDVIFSKGFTSQISASIWLPEIQRYVGQREEALLLIFYHYFSNIYYRRAKWVTLEGKFSDLNHVPCFIHGLINYIDIIIDTKAKYRYLKTLPVNGLCGRCLSVWGPEHHTLPHFTLYTAQRRQSTKISLLSSELGLPLSLYIQSIKSDKHLTQSSCTGKFFLMTTFCFGVFIGNYSMISAIDVENDPRRHNAIYL